MNREFLEGLGLEKEAIDKVMAEHGKTLNDTKAKADKVDGLEEQITDLQGQIDNRDEQLDKLKKVDPEELQAEIDRLKEANETTSTEYQEKLDKQAFDFSLERALVDAQVRNPKAVKALLDTESIKLDGDKLLGLDDQLTALKESDDYLFKVEEEPTEPNTPTITVPGNPDGGSDTTKSIDQMSYQELTDLKTNNPAKFAELTK